MTSVLFGDIVGFTPLSESRDAEEVRELLSRYFAECRTVIARYGGMVEKFIGDAVMAVWGVPVAREDDAERAVRAGLELVAAIDALGEDVGAPGLAMRVGIVTGEVAVTVGATAEGMVAGDAVNTAARVQSAAASGRVWVDETTRRLSSAAIDFEDAGEHSLKGKSEPMRLWLAGRVMGEIGGGGRVDGLEAPLTGRDSDLRLVKELFHATQELRRPRLVVLDGEAGIGKSRLAWEFEKYVDGLAATARWHRGRCLSYGDGVAFWALAEAIRARFGLVEADAGATVTDHLDSGLVEFIDDPGEREWLRPRLAVLLGVGGGAAFAREDLFAAWTAFLEDLAEDHSAVVWVIDDAQHADEGLLDFIDHLLATARAPIFVLALARLDLLMRRPGLGGRKASIVRLEPLDDEAMSHLVDGLVVGLPVSAREALVARAEGVPLFAVETVRALIDQDQVIPREGQYIPASGADLDLNAIGAPATLQALVAARIDALAPEERRLVTDASVLGVSFTRDGLIALGSSPESLDPVLDSLLRKEILSVQSDRHTAERGQFRFVQSVVRQVAYATQSRRDRMARHLAAADYLDAFADPGDELTVIIAQHLLDAVESAPAGEPDIPALTVRARDHLERAAARARSVGAPSEAERLLDIALSLADTPPDQARLHLNAATAANDAGHYAIARGHGQTALDLSENLGDPRSAALAAATQATALTRLGDLAGAIEISDRHWRILDGQPNAEPALLALARILTDAHFGRGEMDSAAVFADRMLQHADALGDQEGVAAALRQAGRRYMNIGVPTAASALLGISADFAREMGFSEALARALVSRSALENSRDVEAALGYAQEAVEIARRTGLRPVVDHATLNYSIGLWIAGRLDELGAALAEAWDSVVDPSIAISLETLRVWLADARGEPLPTRETDVTTDNEIDLAWLASTDIAQAVSAGDFKAAATIAMRTLDHILATSGIEDDFGVLWPPLVQAALAATDTTLAERLLDPVDTALPGRISPLVTAQRHRLRGSVAAARGDEPTAIEFEMQSGITALAAFGSQGYRARAEEELGRWLLSQNRHDDAAQLLERARATYQELGATGWLARLDAELARTTEPSH